ncbi:hypothetical protein [Antarcticirhabdus aurantiaca]|uniref:hypothetical protein n=1 Tax=Antarcticirhabdus aurantiaca TaxID=2606717 RepID=UPI00131BCCA1|nr:hypothetical protein [Antarcticirhabdus aurantiaca]
MIIEVDLPDRVVRLIDEAAARWGLTRDQAFAALVVAGECELTAAYVRRCLDHAYGELS